MVDENGPRRTRPVFLAHVSLVERSAEKGAAARSPPKRTPAEIGPRTSEQIGGGHSQKTSPAASRWQWQLFVCSQQVLFPPWQSVSSNIRLHAASPVQVQ